MTTATITTTESACVLDCPDACSLEVTVTDGRVTKLEGSHRNPLTDGFICSKVRAFPRHMYGEERLLFPGLRRGARGAGEFERLSWEAALDLIAERLQTIRQRYGGEAILPFYYGGSNGFLSQDSTDARLFRRLGASQLARTVCAAATTRAATGLYGKMPGVALEDYVHARLIVLWGVNPSVSGIHLVPILREAQKRGAALVVIDPRRTGLAKKADLHLALQPGTDLPVALAIHRWLFENGAADLAFLADHATGADELRRRCQPWTLERAATVAGVEPSQIEDLARRYAAAEPAAIRCGWGQERNRNGGSATAAILALPAVAGKFGRRGGGYTLSNTGAWRIDDSEAIAAPTTNTREINMNLLGETLLAAEPPVRALFVYNANPLMTLPEQRKVRAGLQRDDLFTVVFDQVMTDTARFADVVLPATTFLEHRELRRGYGSTVLQESRPVVSPAGEARSNFEVFTDLVRRLGLEQPGDAVDEEDFTRRLLANDDGGGDERADTLRRDLDEDGLAAPQCGLAPVQMVDVQPRTADGKIHLVPEALDREAPQGLYAYQQDPKTESHPLALVSPATHRTVSSTLGQLYRKQVAVEIDPADAASRGLESGDRVRVYNHLGEVRCRVRVSADLRPGVACLPKGLWSLHTENGETANALAPSSLTDLAGGACFNDARVEIEKI